MGTQNNSNDTSLGITSSCGFLMIQQVRGGRLSDPSARKPLGSKTPAISDTVRVIIVTFSILGVEEFRPGLHHYLRPGCQTLRCCSYTGLHIFYLLSGLGTRNPKNLKAALTGVNLTPVRAALSRVLWLTINRKV